jgi:hypothetical protein
MIAMGVRGGGQRATFRRMRRASALVSVLAQFCVFAGILPTLVGRRTEATNLVQSPWRSSTARQRLDDGILNTLSMFHRLWTAIATVSYELAEWPSRPELTAPGNRLWQSRRQLSTGSQSGGCH